MSQVLTTLGDTVGAVIDNEATSNRWLRVITGMSSPLFVRLRSSTREMLTPSYVEKKSEPAVFLTADRRFRLDEISLTADWPDARSKSWVADTRFLRIVVRIPLCVVR